MQHTEQLSHKLLFSKAFDIWISRQIIRAPGYTGDAEYISARTESDYRQYASALQKMFVSLRLCDIHDGHVREYHRARALCDGPWTHKCGANRIRKEVGMLLRILVASGAWTAEQNEAFQRLKKIESDVPRAMDTEEERRFLATANASDEGQFVLMYTIAALQTTMSTIEMRRLRIGDVAMHQGIVQVRRGSAKNRFRIRSIPIETEACRWAFEALLYRAYSLGCSKPEHFLFPFREAPGFYDPTRSMSDSGLKKQWDQVRKAAGLKWLRPYDLRHTGITRMAENGVPISVILSFAGHLSQRMQQHYTQISMMAKRKAVASTWTPGMPPRQPRSLQGIRLDNSTFSYASEKKPLDLMWLCGAWLFSFRAIIFYFRVICA